ncbi:hypothetical protein ACIF70_39615 [Actinacidiphila glaucinigra]|uniref:hypothetical protein n=1 Tax=Actinacidiphila glaucinigra TaxID=235986 RepID=UPI0037C71275
MPDEPTSRHPKGLRSAWNSRKRRLRILVLLIGVGIAALACLFPRQSSPGTSTGVSVAQMQQTVASLLPSGRISWESDASETKSRTSAPTSSTAVRLQFDTKTGAAQVAVVLVRLPRTNLTDFFDCPDRAHQPYDHCTVTELDDGSNLLVNKGYANPVDSGSPQVWFAVLTTSDGTAQIQVSEQASGTAHIQAPARLDLPLSEERLVALVRAKGWTALASRLPRPAAPPEPLSRGALEARSILAAVDDGLPTGIKAVRRDGARTGYADALLDDGSTKTLITVTVQDWQPRTQEMEELFKNARSDAAGTRVVMRKHPAPSGGGAVQWDVDVLYSDGRRVVVTELNAMAFGLPANRSEPPLPMETLRSLAEDAQLRS